jgi:hypothetical protein
MYFSNIRLRYYDSEITSIIRYAHCSGKFNGCAMDVVKKELFPVIANAAIMEEVAPVNVGLGPPSTLLFVVFYNGFPGSNGKR